jgi:hypothetical protein
MGRTPNTWVIGPSGWDSIVRLVGYWREVGNNAERLLRQLADPELTVTMHDMLDLQRQAVEDRNRILQQMRSLITPFGRAFSEALKEEGAHYEVILARYLLRTLQDRNAVLDLLRRLNLRNQTMRDRFNDLVGLLIQGQFTTQVDLTAPDIDRELREGYATAISEAATGLDEQALIQRIEYHRDRGQHQQGLGLLVNLAGTEQITQRIIRASGRTNVWINRIAAVLTGGTAVALFTGGTVTICYAFGVPMPLTLVNVLALPGTTPTNLATTAVQTLTQLGTGFVVDRVNRGSCGCMCVRDARGWRRPLTVLLLYYLPVLILGVIFQLFLPSPRDEWGDYFGNQTNSTFT